MRRKKINQPEKKKLLKNFNKNGISHTQLERVGDVALYECEDPHSGMNSYITYEVVFVKQETYPIAPDLGKKLWVFENFSTAEEKVRNLVDIQGGSP